MDITTAPTTTHDLADDYGVHETTIVSMLAEIGHAVAEPDDDESVVSAEAEAALDAWLHGDHAIVVVNDDGSETTLATEPTTSTVLASHDAGDTGLIWIDADNDPVADQDRGQSWVGATRAAYVR